MADKTDNLDSELDRTVTRDLGNHAGQKAEAAIMDALMLCRDSRQRIAVLAIFIAQVSGVSSGILCAETGTDPDEIEPLDIIPTLMKIAKQAADAEKARTNGLRSIDKGLV